MEAVQRGVRNGLVGRGRLLPESERLIAGFQRQVASVLGLGIDDGGGDLDA